MIKLFNSLSSWKTANLEVSCLGPMGPTVQMIQLYSFFLLHVPQSNFYEWNTFSKAVP